MGIETNEKLPSWKTGETDEFNFVSSDERQEVLIPVGGDSGWFRQIELNTGESRVVYIGKSAAGNTLEVS